MQEAAAPNAMRRWYAAALSSATLAACTPVPSVPAAAAPAAAAAASVAAPAVGRSASAASSVGLSEAAPEAALEAGFARWVTAFRVTARAAGIGDETLQAAFDHAHYLPRVIELDRSQPEFTRSVWDYLDSAVTPQRIARGQDKLLQLRAEAEADAAAARYGVPPEIVIAIWGMESNYGTNYGDTPTIDALATLGFEGRREEWARGQLLAALHILQSGDIDHDHMTGSWAGAMGQTQFLPSNFLAYAVDADGDGRRDIWGSMADVIASTANFLARSGWQAGQPWGVEVRLPAGFDVGRADATLKQPSTRWSAEGVRGVDGAALPTFADAAILLPAGARGPAFMVGPNFRTILRYNNSTSYALAVGLLATRLAGGPGVQAAWPRDLVALTRSQLLALQTALNQRGFASGTPDGVMGPTTRDGIRRYQRSLGQPADGYPTLEMMQSLQGP